ncbi:MAG: hypothetical protein R2789_15835 [Microthrixaceae bacterium]
MRSVFGLPFGSTPVATTSNDPDAFSGTFTETLKLPAPSALVRAAVVPATLTWTSLSG